MVYVFLAVITEIVNGKFIEFDQMNNLQKGNCVARLQMQRDNGVLHCDLRPSNFIFNECFIIDFGFSRISETMFQI